MPKKRDRQKPCAHALDPQQCSSHSVKHGRLICISTCRGETTINVDEAATLIDQLKRSITETKTFLKRKARS